VPRVAVEAMIGTQWLKPEEGDDRQAINAAIRWSWQSLCAPSSPPGWASFPAAASCALPNTE
jgi:hypothetical protein